MDMWTDINKSSGTKDLRIHLPPRKIVGLNCYLAKSATCYPFKKTIDAFLFRFFCSLFYFRFLHESPNPAPPIYCLRKFPQ